MIKETFRKYLEEAIGSDKALVAFSAFDSPASTAVRRNPFKSGQCPEGRPVPWCRHGYILDQRPVFTLDPHFHAGAYYIQDSSSMFVGHAFRDCWGILKFWPEDRSEFLISARLREERPPILLHRLEKPSETGSFLFPMR